MSSPRAAGPNTPTTRRTPNGGRPNGSANGGTPRAPVPPPQPRGDDDPIPFNVDEAFLLACRRTGVAPDELKLKPLEDFKEKGIPDDVVSRRYNHHKEARLRKLKLVNSAREKVLVDANGNDTQAQAIPKPPTRQEAVSEMTVSTHHRRREVLLRIRDRQQHHEQLREHQQRAAQQRALEFEKNWKRKTAAEQQQAARLHKENQELMRAQWEHDNQVALIREAKARDFEERMQCMRQALMKEIEDAENRRLKKMEEAARHHGDGAAQVEQRLENAKEHRARLEEERRARLRAKEEYAQKQQEDLTVQKFLRLADLAARDNAENENINKVISTAKEIRDADAQETQARLDKKHARSARVLAKQQQKLDQHLAELAKQRAGAQEHAATVRMQILAQRRARQDRLDEERARRREEREAKRELAKMLGKADAEAKAQHHEDIVKRVHRRQMAEREDIAEAQRRRQEKAEEVRRANEDLVTKLRV